MPITIFMQVDIRYLTPVFLLRDNDLNFKVHTFEILILRKL